MSKGSKRRPSDVSDEVVRENWERVFNTDTQDSIADVSPESAGIKTVKDSDSE